MAKAGTAVRWDVAEWSPGMKVHHAYMAGYPVPKEAVEPKSLFIHSSFCCGSYKPSSLPAWTRHTRLDPEGSG